MGKSTKTFINKKKAVTFHLVHRSQHDPLIADETAPQRVLVEKTSTENQCIDIDKRRQEQKQYGITFDDNYDYLQHFKKPEQGIWECVENPNQTKKRADAGLTAASKLKLPSSVFESEFQEEDGMLNRAAPRVGPRPDWDPDVVAALDEDFDFENKNNLLEDDFVLKAMESKDDDNDSEGAVTSDGDGEDELRDRLMSLMSPNHFDDEETKSRFTDYSISSSVICRNEQLTLLDDRFEKFYATYDDPELGDLCTEEIEGTWGQKHPSVLGCYRLFKRSEVIEDYNKIWDKYRIEKYGVLAKHSDSEEEFVELEVKDPNKKKWDCESVISTYSNNFNHPKVIDDPTNRRKSLESKIKRDPETSLPEKTLHKCYESQITVKGLANLENCASSTVRRKSLCGKSVISAISVLSIRPKDESRKEKKERKCLLKEYRQERRIERKANALAFKVEKEKQVKIKLNAQYNVQ